LSSVQTLFTNFRNPDTYSRCTRILGYLSQKEVEKTAEEDIMNLEHRAV